MTLDNRWTKILDRFASGSHDTQDFAMRWSRVDRKQLHNNKERGFPTKMVSPRSLLKRGKATKLNVRGWVLSHFTQLTSLLFFLFGTREWWKFVLVCWKWKMRPICDETGNYERTYDRRNFWEDFSFAKSRTLGIYARHQKLTIRILRKEQN